MMAASNVPNYLLRLPVGIDNVYTLIPLPIGNKYISPCVCLKRTPYELSNSNHTNYT